MSADANVCLDCIIFGLQRVGGISNYWTKLIEFATASPHLSTRLLMQKRTLDPRYRERWESYMVLVHNSALTSEEAPNDQLCTLTRALEPGSASVILLFCRV